MTTSSIVDYLTVWCKIIQTPIVLSGTVMFNNFFTEESPLLVRYINVCKLAYNEFLKEMIDRKLVGDDINFNEIDQIMFERYHCVISRWTLKSIRKFAIYNFKSFVARKPCISFNTKSSCVFRHKVCKGILLKKNIIKIKYWGCFSCDIDSLEDKINKYDIVKIQYKDDDNIFLTHNNFSLCVNINPVSLTNKEIKELGIKF